MQAWDRPAWSFTTCPRCISRPTRATGSASPGSSKSGGWSRRSPSACSLIRTGFPLMVSAFEGNTAETKTMLPGDQGVHGGARPSRRDGRRGRRHGVGGQSEGHRGRRAVVHPGHEDPPHPLRRRPVAARAPRRADPGRARVHPALARWAGRRPPGPGDLLPVPPRPGPPHAARDRPAGHQGRAGRRRERPGEAQPVYPAVRRHQEGEPGTGGEARALAGIKGHVTNLRACPDGTPSPRSS
jgi:hypothetical protein